jgi:hypothetical protein
MTRLHFIAQYHHHGYGGGTVDWLTHMVVSSIAHAMIFNVMFRVLHGLTLMRALVLVGIVLAIIFMWGRARDRGDGDAPRRYAV